MSLHEIDVYIINWMRRWSVPFSRFGLFVIFFWFGFLKVLGFSPASGLVKELLQNTIPFMRPETFVICFGFFEMLIGILFIIKGQERTVIPLLMVHMAMTFMPLFVLPAVTWSGFLIPTLEGQYIIKNLVIIATAIGIASHLHPLRK